MAFRTSLVRGANKHLSTYGTVLDRFLVSNSSALTPVSTTNSTASASSSSSVSAASSSSVSASTSALASASLFEPTKSNSTGCWHPPKYSLRRQAQLVREAALTGQLSTLPEGRKTQRMVQRLQRLQKSHAFEQTSSQYQYVPKEGGGGGVVGQAAKGSRPAALGERVVKPSQRVSEQERMAALNAARQQVKDVGPYAGRAKIFKGSRVDKDKTRRSQDVRNKLDSMNQTVHEWHSVSLIANPHFPASAFSKRYRDDQCADLTMLYSLLACTNRHRPRQRTSSSPVFLSKSKNP